jgi:hypothetical protein
VFDNAEAPWIQDLNHTPPKILAISEKYPSDHISWSSGTAPVQIKRRKKYAETSKIRA